MSRHESIRSDDAPDSPLPELCRSTEKENWKRNKARWIAVSEQLLGAQKKCFYINIGESKPRNISTRSPKRRRYAFGRTAKSFSQSVLELRS
jgi:hypothetical protein